jgi:hypothetical protein
VNRFYIFIFNVVVHRYLNSETFWIYYLFYL